MPLWNCSFLRIRCCLQLLAVRVGSREAGCSPWDDVPEMAGQLSIIAMEDIPAAEDLGCFVGLYAGEVRSP